MSLPTWVQGSRHTAMRLQWVRRDNTYPDLTGTAITGKIRVNGSMTAVALTGTIAPDTTAPQRGYFTYAPSSADVASAGIYQVQFIATYADSKPDLTFITDWTITAAL